VDDRHPVMMPQRQTVLGRRWRQRHDSAASVRGGRVRT
jgi:hypothetical protein